MLPVNSVSIKLGKIKVRKEDVHMLESDLIFDFVYEENCQLTLMNLKFLFLE